MCQLRFIQQRQQQSTGQQDNIKIDMEQKDKKISQLRNLLAAAKNKLEQFKAKLESKDRQIQQLRTHYDRKIKDMETQSDQVIKQYEQRQLRYQKSLQDTQNQVTKYQAQAITNSRSNEIISTALTQIGNLTMRIFTLNIVKDPNEAVEDTCNIQKCQQFTEQVDKIQKNQDLLPAIKSILKLTALYSQALSKKKESRRVFMMKEEQLKKHLAEEQDKVKEAARRIAELQRSMKNSQTDWNSKLEQINKSKVKMSEQMANLQFIKQLMLKVFTGPKQAANMALEVLAKVLNMTSDEIKNCSKKIK